MIDVWLRRARVTSAQRHTWVRERVAGTLGVSARDVALRRNERGALVLEDAACHLSLSDHGVWLALAVSVDGPVGLDVLTVPDDVQWVGDTSLVLSADEIRYVRTADRDQQGAAFAACWTRKEAYAKWLGTGLTTGLADVSVTPVEPRDLGVEVRTWQLGDATLALATNASPHTHVALHGVDGHSALAQDDPGASPAAPRSVVGAAAH